MANRAYKRNKQGQFASGAGATQTTIGRAGGFAKGNKVGGGTRTKGGALSKRQVRAQGLKQAGKYGALLASRGVVVGVGATAAGVAARRVGLGPVGVAAVAGIGARAANQRFSRERAASANKARVKYRTDF